MQNRYGFADREWDYVVDYCESNRIAFIPWYPLGAGRVAGEVLNRIAQAHHASPTQVALAWLLRRSATMLPIPGTSSIDHLEQNIAAATLRLTDKQYEELSEASEPTVPHRGQAGTQPIVVAPRSNAELPHRSLRGRHPAPQKTL